MTRSHLRVGLAIAGAVLALATTGVTNAAKQATLPPIQVVGVDDVCDSFSTSFDSTTGGAIITCARVAAGPGAPTGCSATINSGSTATFPAATGGVANLAVSGCASTTTASSAITYNWSKNGAPGASTSATFTDTLPANLSTTAVITSYQVKACAGTACATFPASPLTATVSGATGSGGGGGGGGNPGAWNGTCPGFANTRVLIENWTNPTRMLTSSYGGFGPNDIIVLQFTTGSGTSVDYNLPRIAAAEYQAGPAPRIAAISDTPCDFVGLPFFAATSNGTSITLPFTLNNQNNFGFYPILQNNKTYYVNVKMAPSSGCTSVCDMFFDLSKNGTP